MAKLKCQTCANCVNGIYCTMQKTMFVQSYKYKKCDGYQKYVAPPPKPEPKKRVEIINYDELGDFGKFLKSGGHYNMRLRKYNCFK